MTHDPNLNIGADDRYPLINKEGFDEWLGDQWSVYASIGGVRMRAS